MARRLRGLLFALGLALLSASAQAAPDTSPSGLSKGFDEANALFHRGKFTEAAAAYERLLASGQRSAALCFNLGNAWFKAGQLGRAIASYRQAEQLAPRDPDVRANLRFARNTVVAGGPPPPPVWRRWPARLTVDEWTGLAAGLFWVCAGLLVTGLLRPALRLPLRRFVVFTALATCACGLALALAWQERFGTAPAIVVMRDTVLRHGPLDESPSLQTLQDGQELTVLDRKENWLLVAGASRGQGWLKREQVAVLPAE
jgi:tetratricopeptide (TPR) repeat protein